MFGGTYFVIAILALAIIFLMRAIKVVPQGHVYTVERFGRYTHSLMPGLGIITATAIAATVTDAEQFSSGRQFAAWLGLTPRQHSNT